MSSSLLSPNNQQMLLSSDQMPASFFAEDESGRNPVFTAARFFSADPERYKAIIALTAEGLGALRIAAILHVSPHTVLAVRRREPQSVAIEKERIATLSRDAARMCVEGIIDLLADPVRSAKVPARDLGILAGILTDKSELLSGGPTMRIDHQRDVSPEDVRDYLSGLQPADARLMGLEEGSEGANRGELGPAPAAAVDREQVQDPAAAGRELPSDQVEPGGAGQPGAQVDPASAEQQGPEPAGAREPSTVCAAPGADQDQAPGVDPGASGSVGQAPHRETQSASDQGDTKP